MNFIDLIQKQNQIGANQASSITIYSDDDSQYEVSLINLTNIERKGDWVYFDLSVASNNAEGTINIIPVGQRELQFLKTNGFPRTLNNSVSDFLFKSNKYSFSTNEKFNSLKIKLTGDQNSIIVSLLTNEIKSSHLIKFSSSNTLFKNKTNVFKNFRRNYRFYEDAKNPLQSLVENTYVSNFLSTYDRNQNLNILFCADVRKMINDFSYFPNLIKENDTTFNLQNEIESFILKTEVELDKYDKAKFGNNFEKQEATTRAEIVQNISIGNSFGKFMLNAPFANISNLSEYQATIVFYFNDFTIQIAKGRLEQFKNSGLDTEQITSFAKDVLSSEFLAQISQDLNQIDLLPPYAVRDLKDKIILEAQKEIDFSEIKSDNDENTKSQYTNHYFNSKTIETIKFIVKQKHPLSLKQNKTNVFLRGVSANEVGIYTINSQQMLERIGNPLSEINNKTFAKVDKILNITRFKIIDIIDKSKEETNLRNQIDVGNEEQLREERIGKDIPDMFLELSSTNLRQVGLSYLSSMGDSASSLIFEKITPEILSGIENGQRILIKIDNESEFFNSYFYVVG